MGGANAFGQFLQKFSESHRQSMKDKTDKSNTLLDLAMKTSETAQNQPLKLEDGSDNPLIGVLNKQAADYAEQAHKAANEKHGKLFSFLSQHFKKKGTDMANAMSDMGPKWNGPPEGLQPNAQPSALTSDTESAPEEKTYPSTVPFIGRSPVSGQAPSQNIPTQGNRVPAMQDEGSYAMGQAQPVPGIGSATTRGMYGLGEGLPYSTTGKQKNAILHAVYAKRIENQINDADAAPVIQAATALSNLVEHQRAADPNFNANVALSDPQIAPIFEETRNRLVNLNAQYRGIHGKDLFPNINDHMNQILPGYKEAIDAKSHGDAAAAVKQDPNFTSWSVNHSEEAQSVLASIASGHPIASDSYKETDSIPDERPGHQGEWVKKIINSRTGAVVAGSTPVPANKPDDVRKREQELADFRVANPRLKPEVAQAAFAAQKARKAEMEIKNAEADYQSEIKLASLRDEYLKNKGTKEEATWARSVSQMIISMARAQEQADYGTESVDTIAKNLASGLGLNFEDLMRKASGAEPRTPIAKGDNYLSNRKGQIQAPPKQ